jgi:hypothetical protein
MAPLWSLARLNHAHAICLKLFNLNFLHSLSLNIFSHLSLPDGQSSPCFHPCSSLSSWLHCPASLEVWKDEIFWLQKSFSVLRYALSSCLGTSDFPSGEWDRGLASPHFFSNQGGPVGSSHGKTALKIKDALSNEWVLSIPFCHSNPISYDRVQLY